MRGKAERARSGKIPQGTGKGIYGYLYDKTSGRRVVATTQAKIVRGIYSDFLSGISIVNITNCLNESGVPTFTGAKWYPVTIHHVLRNETYTGRTIYRRTLVSMIRDPNTGRKKRRVTERDPSEWIEIEGATPTIIDPQIFQAAQRILDDPERRRRGRRIHEYFLSGRTKCLLCGRAMVGQTLRGTYRYYRCRRAFAGPKHDRCPALYVRADDLERAVREQAARVLANPELILAEADRLRNKGVNLIDSATLEGRLTSLEHRRGRLLKLYEMGEIDDEYLHRESKALKAENAKVEDQLHRGFPVDTLPKITDLRQACRRIEDWVLKADGDDFNLILDALQIEVHAEKGRGELKGLIPEYAPNKSDADVRSMVINFSAWVTDGSSPLEYWWPVPDSV